MERGSSLNLARSSGLPVRVFLLFLCFQDCAYRKPAARVRPVEAIWKRARVRIHVRTLRWKVAKMQRNLFYSLLWKSKHLACALIFYFLIQLFWHGKNTARALFLRAFPACSPQGWCSNLERQVRREHQPQTASVRCRCALAPKQSRCPVPSGSEGRKRGHRGRTSGGISVCPGILL